ncbi:ABC transporter ATP-binding protein [Leifsonia sp. A12D58]|uniref:ABC transporter ATP-binding protein n=1 Tax=Leifsonia sp. A12D58 TaxID=3397674 RepID=UPI0039DFA93E
MPELLTIDRARVTYKQPGRQRLVAVNDVSLSLGKRQVLGLVGESGCGKSTLAKAICGLEGLAGGSIEFNGIPVKKLGMHKRDKAQLRIQMVFQNPYASLNPRRTIGRQIEDGLRVNPDSSAWTVPDLLDHVELDASARDRFPHQFSGGQRQRIAIARAIAAGPELLVGDEPIASLDASLQAKVAGLMRRLSLETGASLLFISHDLSVVRVIADDVAVMSHGSIVESGKVDEIWSNPQQPYTQQLLASIPKVDGLGILPG